MTTIIYDHKNKQIAVDSLATNNGTILTDKIEKWRFVNGDIWFFSGITCDFDLLIEAYSLKHTNDKLVPEARAIIVSKGKVFAIEIADHGAVYISEMLNSARLGSGGDWALAALDHGKTARQAVEYAKTRDCYTGGKVHVFDINKNKFVRG